MLSLGTLYVISEWLIRIAMLVYVPQRRTPASARAWLLLIFFLPWPGLLLYALIGRAYLPRRRLEQQSRLAELMQSMPQLLGHDARATAARHPEIAEAARLASRLGSFEVVRRQQHRAAGRLSRLARAPAARHRRGARQRASALLHPRGR